MNSEERSNEEIRAIRRRWSRDGGMGNERSAEDYTDAGCRVLAEHAFADVASLLARIAAVEALPGELVREIDKQWLVYQQTIGSDAEHEARLTGAMSGLSAARLIVQSAFRRAVLAASPTPTGPEPAKRPRCARPGWCACDPLMPGDEHCRWFAATPTEPTEETKMTESIVCFDGPDCERRHGAGMGGILMHPPEGARISGCDGVLIPDEPTKETP